MNNKDTILLSTGQAIVKFLDQQYIKVDNQEVKFVEGFLTIFGHGNVVGLGEALVNFDHSFKIIQGRNEQGMGHVATGFAKQNKRNKIFAVTTSVGPGAANLVTSAATATANNIPLLLFPGDIYASRQPDPVLQQLEFSHDINLVTNDALKAVTRFWDRIYRPEQIMSSLLRAMAVLTDSNNTGAVAICLPQDVQAETYEYPISFFKKRVWLKSQIIPNDSSFDHVVSKIINAKKPLMIVGGGAYYSNAGDTINKFAKKFNIPFAFTHAGKSLYIDNEELNLGGIGVLGTLCANKLARQADCIIGLGTKYSDFVTCSKTLFSDNAQFININISKFDALKFDSEYLIGEVAAVLDKLYDFLEMKNYHSSYQTEIRDAKNEWVDILAHLAQDNKITINNKHTDKTINDFKEIYPKSINQTQAFLTIQNVLKYHCPNSIVVGAAGSLPGDMQRLWNVSHHDSYHLEYGYSCMGYEIAASLGVKLANPNSEVFALVGDGSFLMLHSELMTAIQEKQKINILLFDNSGYGCIDNLQTSCGIKSAANMFRYRNGEEQIASGQIIKMDYQKIAEGYGCKSYKVDNLEDLEVALKAAIQEKQSSLIHIITKPKTMSDGYDSWWRVDPNRNSNVEDVRNVVNTNEQWLKKARKY